MNLTSPSASVRFLSGATFTGVANLSTNSATLAIQAPQTLTAKTVNMDGANARFAIDGTNTVTLGAGTLVRGRGTVGGQVFLAGTNALINQGAIRADLSGQTLTIGSDTFTNEAAGVVEAINNSTLTISATNWSNAGQINATGSAAVNLGGTFSNPGVVNTSTGGVINVTGTWNNAGNYTFPGTGSLTLQGGTISGGQITPGGGKTLLFTNGGGILSNGALFNGDLNLAAPSATVRLQSGATFSGVANLSTSIATLAIQDTQTLTGKTINMDGTGARFAIDGTNTVTLGTGTLVRGRGTLGGQVFLAGTNALTNQATIRADIAGQTLTVSPDVFTNQAAGIAEASNGSTLLISATNWSSAGQINATSSAAVNLGGTFSSPGVVNTSTGGVVNVTGTWNNAGNYTFPGTASMTLLGGVISGGQITPGGGGQTLLFANNNNNRLSNGAVFNGNLNLSLTNARLRLQSGATFTGAANLSSAGAILGYEQTGTLTGKTINLDGVSNQLSIDGNNTLTLGTGTLVRGRGTVGTAFFLAGTSALINQGTIRADLTGQQLAVSGDTFTNQAAGVVEAINDSTLTINATNWSSAGQINATGSAAANLGGTFSSPGIVNTSTGGVVNVTGTWNNAGNYTFPGTGSLTLLGGVISGGQITPGGGGQTLLFANSTNNRLSNGAVFNGDLNLSLPNARLRLQTGATFANTANLTGTGATLGLEYTGTLTGKTINLDGPSVQLSIDGNNTVTFGAGTLVRGRGTVGNQFFLGGTNGLTNQGTIRADLAGQTLTVTPDGFSQQGILEAINGSTLSVPAGFIQTAGTTRVDGSTITTNTGTSIVIVAGSLEGKGTVNSNVSNSGTISPGLSAGALSILDDLSLTGTSIIRIELGGTTQGTTYDLLSEAGTIPLTLAGTLNVSFINGFETTVQVGNTFTIITSNAAIGGAFNNIVLPQFANANGSGTFTVSVVANNVILTAVPEPSAALLTAGGMLALLSRRRRGRDLHDAQRARNLPNPPHS